jgi:hypothetical protein
MFTSVSRLAKLALAALLGALAACQSAEEKQQMVERKVRQQLLLLANSPAKSVQITAEKDKKDLYYVVAEMENGRRIDLYALTNGDSVVCKESLNSQIGWQLSRELAQPVRSIKFQEFKSGQPGEMQGEVELANGQLLRIFAVENLGWRPANDLNTLTFLTRLQIQQAALDDSTNQITDLVLEPDSLPSLYKGHFTATASGKKLIKVNWNTTGFTWDILN